MVRMQGEAEGQHRVLIRPFVEDIFTDLHPEAASGAVAGYKVFGIPGRVKWTSVRIPCRGVVVTAIAHMFGGSIGLITALT